MKCDSGGVGNTKQILFLFFLFFNHKRKPLQCVYHFPPHVCGTVCTLTAFIREDVHTRSRACQLPIPPPSSFPNQSTTLQTHSHFSSHLFIQAVACCFTGTSPCFVLFSPLFVFNCYRGGQLISLPPLSICSPHSCGAVCLLAHLLPSPNATSLQMD